MFKIYSNKLLNKKRKLEHYALSDVFIVFFKSISGF